MGSCPHLMHAFVSLKEVWYSNWKIMTSLSFKQILAETWTRTWILNLIYHIFATYEAWNSDVFRLKYWSNSLFSRGWLSGFVEWNKNEWAVKLSVAFKQLASWTPGENENKPTTFSAQKPQALSCRKFY